MTTPLSPLLFLRRNARKTLPVLGVIVLAVFAVSLTAVLTGSMIHAAEDAWIKPYERFSTVVAARGGLDPGVVAALEGNPYVGRLLPIQFAQIQVAGIFGSDQRPVLGLRADEMRWFMQRTGLRLRAGRLPAPGRAEIALHEAILKGKDVRLGDEVGREVDDAEVLPGRLRVVGVLTGPYPLALTTYETLRGQSVGVAPRGERAYLLFPKPGHRSDLDWDLGSLPRDKALVSTHASAQARFEREIVNMDTMLWILNLVTIVALSLAVGLLNVIFFIQRMGEFGILAALGFRRAALLSRTLQEVLLVTAAGWLAGLGLAHGVFLLISRYVYEPRGIALTGLDGRALAFTAPIPAMIALFSLGVVAWQLGRLDPVTIVERRE